MLGGEQNPDIAHSCTVETDDPSQPEYADPGVRIAQWVKEFGDENGFFFPICAKTLQTAMSQIAEKIHQTIGTSCLSSDLAWRNPSDHSKGHNCVAERHASATGSGGGSAPASNLDECMPIVTNADSPEPPRNPPCYQLLPNSAECDKGNDKQGTLFRVCENADCKAATTSSESLDATISCAIP